MANLTEFRGAIRSGVVRQNKWSVMVNFPTYAATNETIRQTTLLARTTTTPPSTLGVMEIGWGGRILPVPGDKTFEEFPVTFIGVNDMETRNAFERWHEAINGSSSNTGLSALIDIVRDLQLDLLDSNDNPTKTYILRDAFPVNISGMEMDSGSMDSFAEFTVTFRYTHLESNTTR